MSGPKGPDNPSPFSPGNGEEGALLLEVARGICHRTKNDLQTLANLAALAQPYAQSMDDLVEALERRVAALAVSYTLVSETGQPPTLDRLVQGVAGRVTARMVRRIGIGVEAEPRPLSLRLCSPLSLWLHEVMDNAAKHGRPDPTGRIWVRGGLDEREFKLEVSDSGPGLPPGFRPDRGGRLGMKLAWAVATSDLRGRMDMQSRTGGLTVTLTVPAAEFNNLDQVRWR